MSVLIDEKLTDVDFYKNSMSLFLKNSPGMLERCQMFVDILNNLNDSANSVFKWLNIYETTYSNDVNSGWLDLIGEFLGISRYFNNVEVKDSEGNLIRKGLNNTDFLKYIQATIQKYIFDGTRESLREAYYGTRLLNWDAYEANKNAYPKKIQEYLSNIKKDVDLNDLKIQYVQAKTTINGEDVLVNGVCQILCLGEITDNLKILFNAGALTIESLGITYIRTDKYEPIQTARYQSPEQTQEESSKYYDDKTKEMWAYGETQENVEEQK